MIITDYESGRHLRDLGLSLSLEEAKELRAYLDRLIDEPTVHHAFLSEISGHGIEKEIAIQVTGRCGETARLPRTVPVGGQRIVNVY